MLSIQSDSANITTLGGKTVESMIAVTRTVDDMPEEPLVVWMKIFDGNWHRIFMDGGMLYWEELEELDEADMEPAEGIDHLQLMPVQDNIVDVGFRQVGDNAILSIEFESGKGWRMVEDKRTEICSMDFWMLDE